VSPGIASTDADSPIVVAGRQRNEVRCADRQSAARMAQDRGTRVDLPQECATEHANHLLRACSRHPTEHPL